MVTKSDTESIALDLPPLGQWIEDHLRKVGSLRESGGGNYVTSLTGCPLAWVLKRNGTKSDEMSPRGSETLVAGNEREARTLQLLAKAGHPLLGAGDIPLLGLPTDQQERITFQIGGVTFSGRLDGCIYWKDKRILVEIKTFSTRQWDKFLRSGPPRKYKIQTMFYMRALGLDKACIMGQCRDTEARAERWVFYDPKLVAEVEADFARALEMEKAGESDAWASLGWCRGVEGTYYTVKDKTTGESRPAKTGLSEAYQEGGEGFPAGYCEVAYACPLLKKEGYKRVIKEGWSPGWFKYAGDEANETLQANSTSRQKRPPKEFYKP